METCSVAMLEDYLKRGESKLGSEKMLFRGIVSGKAEKLRESGYLLQDEGIVKGEVATAGIFHGG